MWGRLETDSYRPILLLPVLSKIHEKVVKVRLIKYLVKIVFFNKYQNGFISKSSTESAVFDMVSQLQTAWDNKEVAAALFVDLKKAFGTVSHNVLLDKLPGIGVRGVALSWFKNYLSGREQFVVVENAISETLPVVYGVPQGSILGPILFLIYMNDIGNLDLAGTPYLFADDTTTSYRAKTKEGLQDMMSKD